MNSLRARACRSALVGVRKVWQCTATLPCSTFAPHRGTVVAALPWARKLYSTASAQAVESAGDISSSGSEERRLRMRGKNFPEITNAMMRMLTPRELRQQILSMHDELRCPEYVYQVFRRHADWKDAVFRIFNEGKDLHWSDFESFTVEGLQGEYFFRHKEAKAMVAFVRSVKDATHSRPV